MIKRILLTFAIGFGLLFLLNQLGVDTKHWYISLPCYYVGFVVSGFFLFSTSKALIMKFGFRGSELDDETQKYVTHFNVLFHMRQIQKTGFSGIIYSNIRLSKNDVLDMMSSMDKKEILNQLNENEGLVFTEGAFEFNTEWYGENILIHFTEFDGTEGLLMDPYMDYE